MNPRQSPPGRLSLKRSDLRVAALCLYACSAVAATNVVVENAFGDEPKSLAGIVAKHNAVRAGVGVGPLQWDDALAATAQAWANACKHADAPTGLLNHNANRSDGHPWYVGENIYGSTGTATAQAAVNSWAAEAQYYTHATNRCAAGHVCGDYTQLVWANSTHVGCGISTCPNLTYHNTIVCDYGPGGNIGGVRPY
jgi:pathogenesis-related protein 1